MPTANPRRRLHLTCAHVVGSSSAADGKQQHVQELRHCAITAPLPDCSFGQVVSGIDPEALSARPLAHDLRAEFGALLARHQVVVLRFSSPLTVSQMQGVAQLFGEVKVGLARCEDGSTKQYLSYDHIGSPRQLKGSGIMEHRSGFVLRPKLLPKLVSAFAHGGDSTRPFVYESFHTDDTFTEIPAGVTLLHARDLPPSGGGDTLFLDMAAGFQRLAQAEPHTIERLRGRCAEHAYNNNNAFPPRPAARGNEALLKPRHPILRRHHATGAPCLYWDLDRATGEVDGLAWEEGQALLQRLQTLAEETAPRYRHVWQEHDVVVWDNISTQHAAVGDFDVGEKRTMWRMLLEGQPPQPF